MILLNNLPPEYNSLASTIVQTITVANFEMQHVTAAIIMEMDLQATHKPLHAWIFAVQESKDSSSVDLASRFVDHLEDQEMADAISISSNQAYAEWGDQHDEDDGMAVAGPSNHY